METHQKRLKHLKQVGSDYFKENLFIKKEVPRSYDRKLIAFAKKRNGSIYYLDLTEACRILALGMTRCLAKGTLIQTEDGIKKIEDLVDGERVKSYNFETKEIELKPIASFGKGTEKELFEVELEDGRKIFCSEQHTLFIKKEGRIIEKELQNIKVGDDLVTEDDF